MSKNNIKRICLWSGPRNISTTMMYSFAQRQDTCIYDEPFYGYYLKHSDASNYHPNAQEIINSMEKDEKKIITMIMGNHPRPIAFFKNITHNLLDIDYSFIKKTSNIILIRNPIEMLASLAKVIPNITFKDTGFDKHYKLFYKLSQDRNKPIVLDAKHVLQNPKNMLMQLCEKLHIDFDNNMLHWQAGKRPEDGLWAEFWYKSIHKSTGFIPYQPSKKTFPRYLTPLLKKCMPYYEEMYKVAMK